MLAFLTTTCTSCRPFWELLADPGARSCLATNVVVVTPSPSMENRQRAEELTPAGVGLHMGSETWFGYGVAQAGTFVLVQDLPGELAPWVHPEQDHVIGCCTPASPAELLELVSRWRSSGAG